MQPREPDGAPPAYVSGGILPRSRSRSRDIAASSGSACGGGGGSPILPLPVARLPVSKSGGFPQQQREAKLILVPSYGPMTRQAYVAGETLEASALAARQACLAANEVAAAAEIHARGANELAELTHAADAAAMAACDAAAAAYNAAGAAEAAWHDGDGSVYCSNCITAATASRRG